MKRLLEHFVGLKLEVPLNQILDQHVAVGYLKAGIYSTRSAVCDMECESNGIGLCERETELEWLSLAENLRHLLSVVRVEVL